VLSLILLIIFFSWTSENFFSVVTLKTILNQLPALTVVTVGMTLVLIVAGIDLSVGSVLSLSATVIGVLVVGWQLPLPLACLAGIVAGLACGAANGALVAFFRLPAFIVTLGMLEMARGLAYIVNNSQTVYIGSSIQAIALPLPGVGVSLALLIAKCQVSMHVRTVCLCSPCPARWPGLAAFSTRPIWALPIQTQELGSNSRRLQLPSSEAPA